MSEMDQIEQLRIDAYVAAAVVKARQIEKAVLREMPTMTLGERRRLVANGQIIATLTKGRKR